jgi:hypothetical protein
MAVTLTLVSATPHSLKYLWTHDGVGGASIQRTQAQILADFAGIQGPSPLKDALSTTSDAVWAALQASSRLSVYTTITAFGVVTCIRGALVLDPGRVLDVDGVNGAAAAALVEIRFHHTIER